MLEPNYKSAHFKMICADMNIKMYFLFGSLGYCPFRNLACEHLNSMIKFMILLINMYICRLLPQNTLKKS